MRSPSHEPDLYKVGLTRRTPDARAKELSGTTSAPLPFGVLATWQVDDCAAVEGEAHRRLESRRVNPNREFFHGQLREIVAIINDVVSQHEKQ